MTNDLEIFEMDYVKTKNNHSRRAAFSLLLTLCKGNHDNLTYLIDNGLLKLLENFKELKMFSYMPSKDAKSSYGYLGLRNPSCVCYMLAMLQQFYMTPIFRHALLMADDGVPPKIVDADRYGQEVDDNILHQFQRMFGYLSLSDKQDFDPAPFCYSFKDYSGKPVNMAIQQDA